jgi:glutamine synthetase
VKVIDPSANPYFASAAILGLALDGIERRLPVPPETTVDPANLTDDQRKQAGIKLLASSQAEALDKLDQSSLMRAILGHEPVDAVVAVRRYEQENFADLSPDELAEKFRLAWSV